MNWDLENFAEHADEVKHGFDDRLDRQTRALVRVFATSTSFCSEFVFVRRTAFRFLSPPPLVSFQLGKRETERPFQSSRTTKSVLRGASIASGPILLPACLLAYLASSVNNNWARTTRRVYSVG